MRSGDDKQATSGILRKLSISAANTDNAAPASDITPNNVNTPAKREENIKSLDPSEIKKEEKEDLFDYKYMNSFFERETGFGASIDQGKYTAQIIATNKSFIGLYWNKKLDSPSPEGILFRACGLKFHVSLPEGDNDKFGLGWGIIKNILIQHDVCSFKVIRSGLKMSDDSEQMGKDVTIYTNMNPEKTVGQWGEILQEITAKLTLANVSPGYRNKGTSSHPEESISGSNYITYRYDDELDILKKEKRLKHFVERRGVDWWPKKDLIAKIEVRVDKQLAIRSEAIKSADKVENADKNSVNLPRQGQ